MPPAIAADCPPLRVLTTDALGLIKVVESRGGGGTPKIVEIWGSPDATQSIIAASSLDRRQNPVMAVARKNGMLEFRNPLNGEALATTRVSESTSPPAEEDLTVGLHLLAASTPQSTKFLTCTTKGKACLRSIAMGDVLPESTNPDSTSAWDVCNSGKVTCSAVSDNGNYALFGGNRVEVNLWDLDNCTKTWTAKSPPCNSLRIFSPTWFTSATFLSKDDHHKIVAGTNNHQVRLYDISAQRRPVISVTFRESPIKVVTADPDGYTVFIGTGYGDIASFDMRTGKLLGCFLGKCSGSVRSIARHPELPLIASCGLDRYVRLWDTKTRQLLSAVFLKQHLTNVMIDSHFSTEEVSAPSDQTGNLQETNHNIVKEVEESLPYEGTTTPQREESVTATTKKSKKKKARDEKQVSEAHSPRSEDNSDEQPASRRRKQPKESEQGGKIKKRKSVKKPTE